MYYYNNTPVYTNHIFIMKCIL